MYSEPSSPPRKKRLPSFLIVLAVLVAVLACCELFALAVRVIEPRLDSLTVYRHQTNTPGNACGDYTNYGSNPDGDDISYWHDAEDLVVDCQPEQTALRLKEPFSPGFGQPSELTYIRFDGGNQARPALSSVAAMGYQGIYTEVSLTLLPNDTTTQGGILIFLQSPDDSGGPVFFDVDTQGHWQITVYSGAEQAVQTLASGLVPQVKQRYLLRVQVNAQRSTMSFFIDGQQMVATQVPVIDGYGIGLGLNCPADENPAHVCPVAFTAFTFDVAH